MKSPDYSVNTDEESNATDAEGSMRDIALGGGGNNAGGGSSTLEEFTDEDTYDMSNNNIVSDTDDDSRSVVSIKLYRRPSLIAAEETNSVNTEDKGWEDWDNDHRRALGRSHERTLNQLETASIRSKKDDAGQGQQQLIMPSISEFSSAETDSKKRAEYYNNKKRKSAANKKKKNSKLSMSLSCNKNNNKNNKKSFFTRHCILLTSVVVLCFVALVALQHYVILPPGTTALAGTAVLRTDNLVNNDNDNTAADAAADNNDGTTIVVETGDVAATVLPDAATTTTANNFIPLVNRNTEVVVVKVEDNEDNSFSSFFGFLRKYAFIIGNFIYPSSVPTTSNTNSDATAVITAHDLELLKTIQDDLPTYDNLYSNVDEAVMGVQPVLWDTIQRSGSGTLKTILTYCYKLVLSSEMAIDHEEAQALEIYSTEDNAGHFANVNTETLEGLQRAQSVGLVDSNLVHVISTPYIVEASKLFVDKTRTGRIFAMLRHPVEQAHSNFLFRKTLPEGHPEKLPQELTLSQYVESDLLPTNPLTKTLLNMTTTTTTDDSSVTPTVAALTDLHILGAQKILQEHVLVGLLDSFDESLHMFATYFGWGYQHSSTMPSTSSTTSSSSLNNNNNVDDPAVCISNFETANNNQDAHEQLSDEASLEWKTLADRNYADMQLYIFAQSLYQRQKELLLMREEEGSITNNNNNSDLLQ